MGMDGLSASEAEAVSCALWAMAIGCALLLLPITLKREAANIILEACGQGVREVDNKSSNLG